MRRIRLGVSVGGVVALACIVPAFAQSTDLPGIEILAPPRNNAAPKVGTPSGQTSPAQKKGPCEEGKPDSPPSFGCLNEQLKQKVDRVNPTENTPPLDAKSSDLKTGVVNMPAVQQQYGQNFGRSVIPYRPPRPVFAPPLARH
jgi:hypothetical protein